jgi:phosphocarrier protein
VHLANTFKARISVSKDHSRVNGKSILGLLTLSAAKGSTLRLSADGEDEGRALDELATLVRERFGERA